MKEMLIDIAKEAGKLLAEGFEKIEGTHILKKKGERDFSIHMDKMAEDLILGRLKESGIGFKVVTEESGDLKLGNSEYTVFVDPLDGSINYRKGIPYFCTSLAVSKSNEVFLGIVYDPIRKDMYVAEKGKGAFLNGKIISVSKESELKRCVINMNSPGDVKMAIDVFSKLKRVAIVRYVLSAIIDLTYTASGKTDGHVLTNMGPWDLAAGCLIVEEAGGRVTDFKGNKWSPYSKYVIASNGIIHEKFLKVLSK